MLSLYAILSSKLYNSLRKFADHLNNINQLF